MTEPGFAAYFAVAIPDYARAKVESGEWTETASLELSRQGYAELLPQGLATPDNFIYAIRDSATQASVGMIWFSAQERAGKRIAYVYDVYVNAEYRRTGYATRAFIALEDEVKRRGLSGIALHVFGHNTGALALYQKLGYQPTNIDMFKQLGSTGA